MLELPIKEPWYSMINSGKKREEYREIKRYWEARFIGAGLLDSRGKPNGKIKTVRFRNGYGKARPSFCADVALEIKSGVPAWGAAEGHLYYTLNIRKIKEG